jgi:hypothetical protein
VRRDKINIEDVQEGRPEGPPLVVYQPGKGLGHYDTAGNWVQHEKPAGFRFSPSGDGTLIPDDTDATPDEVE